jgi:uncharacterized protein (TIGR02246 family)
MQTTAAPADSIRRLLEEQVSAWNTGDAQGWCKDFTADAAFVNILGMRFEDRDANARRHAELFAGIFQGSHLEMQELKVRVFGEVAATAGAVLDLTHFHKLPPGIRPSVGDDLLRTRMHYVLIHETGRWQIVFSQNTAVAPLPPAG